MSEFLNSLATGFGLGSVYGLVALSFSFIYRATGTFNFAQGQLVTIGSLLAYTLSVKAGLPVLVTLIILAATVAVLGGLTERVAIWPLAGRLDDNNMTWLISTLGVAVLLTGAAERIWGTVPQGVPNYVGPAVLHFGSGVDVPTPLVVAIVVAIAMAVAIELFQRYSLWGKLMRAVADNRRGVELAGINVVTVGLASFTLGGLLSGIAGMVIAPVTYADSTLGFDFVIYAFAAFAIGGFVSHWGALLGGWIVGCTESLGGVYLGLEYQDVVLFGLLIVVLVLRPEGLIAARAARRV